MEKLTKKQAEQMKIIKEYAKGREDFSFTEFGFVFAEYYPKRRSSTVEGIAAMDIVSTTSNKELARLERAYYKGYEVMPDWKFNIGDIVYLAPSLSAPRSLWYVENRIVTRGKAHYILCGDYDPRVQAYRRAGNPPYMEVSEDKLKLIQKKSEWEQTVVPRKKKKKVSPMHPGCGHGSKTQY
ncbi:hypothetical protein HCA69_12340 [Listeria grandensis]|uniref:Uncharacterized protein n=1 Tax=Listeria grandensis TaxID=1494963 RepID=A0A7X0Y545_9LIST|nr:hypothetical protein [Listeria grandensis]MBC1937161.1 hypothetical protein [Listeria grandensis]